MDHLNNQKNNSLYISPNPLDKQIKTIFKKLEKITIRCAYCGLIPRIRLNFLYHCIKFDCDAIHKNNHYYFSSPFDFIKNYENNGLNNDLSEKDNYCVKHKKPIEYAFNFCKKCEQNNLYEDEGYEKKFDVSSEGEDYEIKKLRSESEKYEPINIYNCHDYCSEDLFEAPGKNIKIKDLTNFLFSKEEIENLIKKLELLENKMNSLNIINDNILLYLMRDKKERIIMIYFAISLIRSFIYTYQEMIHKGYLNYNIISNLRRINIEDNFDVEKFLSSFGYNKNRLLNNYNKKNGFYYMGNNYQNFPFFNISMNKFLTQYISKEINNDDFIEEININFKFIEKWWNCRWLEFDKNKLIFITKNKKSFILNCQNILQLQNYELDTNRILSINNSNYILLNELDHKMNYIYIQGYKINNNKELKLLDYQTIEVTSEEIYKNSFDECQIFQDNHGMDIYFLFFQPLVLLVLSKKIINNEEKDFIKEIFNLNHLEFYSNHYYELKESIFISNRNIYYISNNRKFFQFNLDTSENIQIKDNGTRIYEGRREMIGMMEINKNYIMVIQRNIRSCHFDYDEININFINKNESIFSKKKFKYIVFQRRKIFFHLLKENIFVMNYDKINSFYFIKVTKDLDVIKLHQLIYIEKEDIPNFFPRHYDDSFDDSMDEEEIATREKYSIKNQNKRTIVDKNEMINKIASLKNKITRCPHCHQIPKFKGLNFICRIHGKLDIISCLLNEPLCFFCEYKNNLYYSFNLDCFLCERCLIKYIRKRNNLEKKDFLINYKKEYKELKVVKLKNLDNLCNLHLKLIEYTFNMCKQCKEEESDAKYKESYKNRPEDLSNIDFSNQEIEDIKKKLEIIEKKINEIKNKDGNNYYIKKLFEFSIIQSIFYTYITLKRENKLNYDAIKNLRKIKLNQDFNIKNEKIYSEIKINKFLGGEIKNNKISDNNLDYYYEKIDINKLIKKEINLSGKILLDFIENKDIILYYENNNYQIFYKKYKNYLSHNLLDLQNSVELKNYHRDKFYLSKYDNFLFITNSSNIQILNYYIPSNKSIIFELYQNIDLLKQCSNFSKASINGFDHRYDHFSKGHIYEEENKIVCFKNEYFSIINKFSNNLNKKIFQIQCQIQIRPSYINYEVYNNKIYLLYEDSIIEIDKQFKKMNLGSTKKPKDFTILNDEQILLILGWPGTDIAIFNTRDSKINIIYKFEMYNKLHNIINLYKIPNQNIIIIFFYDIISFWKYENNKLSYMNKFSSFKYFSSYDSSYIFKINENIYIYSKLNEDDKISNSFDDLNVIFNFDDKESNKNKDNFCLYEFPFKRLK